MSVQPATKSVLYFHGFASSPASAKITALRPLLTPHGIELNTPDLNVPSFEKLDFDAVVEHAFRAGRSRPPAAIVGSSLGALIALSVVARGLTAPLVLIAPAIGVAARWKEKLPPGDPVVVFNYARNEDVPVHRVFFDQITALRIDEDPPRTRVTVLMGRRDETVPFEMVASRWEEWQQSSMLVPGSKFIELTQGDHSLVSEADVIRAAIVEATAEATAEAAAEATAESAD